MNASNATNLTPEISNQPAEKKEQTEIKKEEKTSIPAKQEIEEEIKFSEGLIYLQHGIFNPMKTKNEAILRTEETPQEYLDRHKIAVYLQDAIKILIERKDERPYDLLNE